MSLYSSLTQVLAPFAAKINGLLTGWDGTKYSTPGEAVRQQISDLHVLIGDTPGTAIQASAVAYEDSNVGAELTDINGRLVPLEDAVNIETEPGKNLYDNASPNIIGGFIGSQSGGVKFSASNVAAAKCLTVQLETNKTYTYAYATAAGGRHSAGLFSSVPVDQQLGDLVPNATVVQGDYTYRKFTTGGTNTVFVLYYYNRNDGIDEDVIREGIMLYEGEDIIPFEPYGDKNILKVEKENLSSDGSAGQALMLDEDGNTLKWGTPAAPVEVDATLTQEGKAADAKATGDRIAQAEEDMQEQLEQVVLTDGVKQWLNDHPEAMVVIKRNSDAEDAPTLGEEIMPTDGWTTDGWTGDFANGFTNTSGNTNPLSVTIPSLEEGALYQFEITTSNAATNGWSDFYVSLGGSDKFETYRGGGASVSYVYGIICGSTKVLTITPRNSYTGTITGLSLKKVSNTVGSLFDLYDSNGVVSFEGRTSLAEKKAVYYGENSGKYAFWGKENTALGANALAANTSGFWNTAVGRRALEANQNGSRNIAIGYIALLHNTGGDRNVAIGTFALEKNTIGRGNVAINADCLQDNTTGGNNIGIGVRALCGNTTGGTNIGIGSNACANNKAASGNVGIGHNALTNNTGSNNVAIGNGAGDLSGMTGSDNIVIGWGADVDAASTSHQIVIGTTRHTSVKIAGKTINFNEDGTVTWSE